MGYARPLVEMEPAMKTRGRIARRVLVIAWHAPRIAEMASVPKQKTVRPARMTVALVPPCAAMANVALMKRVTHVPMTAKHALPNVAIRPVMPMNPATIVP